MHALVYTGTQELIFREENNPKVVNGEIANNLNARLIRDGSVLYTGAINSIFREKNPTKQVAAGLECGITLKDFADFKEKDIIEVYKIIEMERRI